MGVASRALDQRHGRSLELMEYLECGPEGIPSNQQLVRMGDNNNTQSIADYLAQLLKDKKQLAAFPNVFIHMERLLDDEIGKVRGNLFQINGYVKEPLILPEGSGPPVIHSEKVYVPVKEHPDVSIFISLSLDIEIYIILYHIILNHFTCIYYRAIPPLSFYIFPHITIS